MTTLLIQKDSRKKDAATQQIAREENEAMWSPGQVLSKEHTLKHILSAIERATERMQHSLDFYKRRCDALQKIQSNMRDPERKMVCDILANGETYTQPHPSKGSPASGERSEQVSGRIWPKGHDKPMPVKQRHAPRGQQQVWTPEYVRSLMLKSQLVDSTPFDVVICDAHNAELAAECQRRDQADERTERWQWAAECHEHREQEAKQQHLSALAAIEKHNKSIPKEDDSFTINVDLSALHEHDAKVREPLVKLLRKSLLEIRTPMSKRTTHLINEIEEELLKDFYEQSDALTKVKEQ